MFCGTCSPLVGKSTVNRMELSGLEAERYKKIVADFCAMDSVLAELFMRFHKKRPKQIMLEVDVTDDLVHGNQEGRFYTVTTASTVTPLLTYSAGAIFLGVNFGRPTKTPRREPPRSLRE